MITKQFRERVEFAINFVEKNGLPYEKGNFSDEVVFALEEWAECELSDWELVDVSIILGER
jgi:hypothetical protein